MRTRSGCCILSIFALSTASFCTWAFGSHFFWTLWTFFFVSGLFVWANVLNRDLEISGSLCDRIQRHGVFLFEYQHDYSIYTDSHMMFKPSFSIIYTFCSRHICYIFWFPRDCNPEFKFGKLLACHWFFIDWGDLGPFFLQFDAHEVSPLVWGGLRKGRNACEMSRYGRYSGCLFRRPLFDQKSLKITTSMIVYPKFYRGFVVWYFFHQQFCKGPECSWVFVVECSWVLSVFLFPGQGDPQIAGCAADVS